MIFDVRDLSLSKCVILALFALSMFYVSTVEAATCSGVEITASALNVRTGPSTSNTRIGVVHAGERYVETGAQGSWKRIWFDGQQRWIYAVSYTRAVSVNCETVTASALNVRSGPSTAYRIVGTIYRDSEWVIINKQGSWNQIWFASEARWVHGSYMTSLPAISVTHFSINSGAAITTSRFVSADVAVSNTAAEYQISESSTFQNAVWQAYTSNPQFTLSDGDGTKQVYFRVKDASGRISPTVSDTIVLQLPGNNQRNIDRASFYQHFRTQFGPLSQSQVDGINYLLTNMEGDQEPAVNVLTVWRRQIAYTFATVKHEVANTYLPITEFSNTHCVNYDGGCRYKGRGYVQLTHRFNYQNMSSVVGVDLVSSPERALEPDIAYRVMSYGMHHGSFTGRKLGDYVNTSITDYYNARRVVNGLDKADLIRGYANKFQIIMDNSSN